MARQQSFQVNRWIEAALQLVLLTILGLVVIHAPLSVFFGGIAPEHQLLIKGWKELLLLVGLAIGFSLAFMHKTITRDLLKDKLLWLMGGYVALHLALALLSPTTMVQSLAGLAIDLRYILFFVLIYAYVKIRPSFRRQALIVSAAGALVVLLFGILQILVLPKDFLAVIGYSVTTIQPYLTIDQNENFIRINSTLRGPNPLGAYVLIVATVALAYLTSRPSLVRTKPVVAAALIAIMSPAVLWASYSRSALVATVMSIVLLMAFQFRHRIKAVPLIVIAAALLLIGSTGVYALRDTYLVQNVILHSDPADDNQINSNEGHVESLLDGSRRAAEQPLGAGIGSTGSASLLGDKPIIIENQYLFIAHEAGWLGLALFIAITGLIGWRLWLQRSDWLAVAMLTSGVGLALIGLLLPVWADDTVSLVWWGLAALALASSVPDRRSVLS